jgi:diguanylate cyclase (GGDEF)-like protein
MTVIGLPETAALAAVALIGYLFGQRTHKLIARALASRRQRELDRAAHIAWQLETIADSLRQELATHHSQIAGFKRRLRQAQEQGNDKSWELLCGEAESMLGPTMQLAQQLAHAYDEIRQQSEALETFTKARTDPLTGVGNGRALEQQFDALLKAAQRGAGGFAVALVSMDRKPTSGPEVVTHREVMLVLPKLAGVIRSCMREADFVARYGDEEFVVLMPKTSLAGACVFGNRLRKRVEEQLSATVCCGIAEFQTGDESKTLLGRADSAFYSAKAAGLNRQYVHTGSQIREHLSQSKPGVPTAADGTVLVRNVGTPPSPKPSPKKEALAESTPKKEAQAETKPNSESQPTAASKPPALGEPQVEAKPIAETKPTAEIKPRTENRLNAEEKTKAADKARAKGETKSKGNSKSKENPQAGPDSTAKDNGQFATHPLR